MTIIFDDPSAFADDALDGFVAANRRYVARVDGGVIRATESAPGQVAVVVGGGSGHYPAFAGLVGPGLAAAAVCGNLFSSPSSAQAVRVATAAQTGGGVLLAFGNYAGDILHFGEAQKRLVAAGIPTRTVLVTDDIASAPRERTNERRGIAGDLVVFKVAGAAAEAGHSLDEVERLARQANDRTRSVGVAFGGCTFPGATEPLFTVPDGRMSLGMGIHGEPGIAESDRPSASELATLLVDTLLADRPDGAGTRVVPILNGLGTVKYDELFVLFARVEERLVAAGLDVVEPECGEFVTSLDMAGLSLTLLWLDSEIDEYWFAPTDTPAFRRGSMAPCARREVVHPIVGVGERPAGTAESVRLGREAASALERLRSVLAENEERLGRLDAIAGDGDHGIGMLRGIMAAAAAAADSDGEGIDAVLCLAGEAWSDKAGGTSGALWGAALMAVGQALGNNDAYGRTDARAAAVAFAGAITDLGGAALGDKTMVDALVPFLDTATAQLDAGVDLARAFDAAATAAESGAAATTELVPMKGRARPLAEKSLGHRDPGAESFALVARAIAQLFAGHAGTPAEPNRKA